MVAVRAAETSLSRCRPVTADGLVVLSPVITGHMKVGGAAHGVCRMACRTHVVPRVCSCFVQRARERVSAWKRDAATRPRTLHQINPLNAGFPTRIERARIFNAFVSVDVQRL